MGKLLTADRILHDGRLREGLEIEIDGAGRVARVGARSGSPATELRGRALLPGLVNAHSHAFQRALRGRAQSVDSSAPRDDFWTWRGRMYALAERLDPESLRDVARFAFVEMALAGTTTVGEFHYIHAAPDGRPYEDPDSMALALRDAAAEAGIRLVILCAAYARAGAGRSPEGVQRRFASESVDAFLARAERLAAHGPVGLAPHSVRALDRPWLEQIAAAASATPWPVHAHVAEQTAEVEACLVEHGLRPVDLLDRVGLLSPRFVAVHATHLSADEHRLLGRAGAQACICPTTERDLGDGLPDLEELESAGVALSVGTDGQIQPSVLEEARGLEMNERLSKRRRCVLGGGDPASFLLDAATQGGARALGIAGGRIAVDQPADFFSVALGDPALAGARIGEALLPTIVLSADTRAIRDVFVEGRRIVEDGRHVLQEAAAAAFERALERLWR